MKQIRVALPGREYDIEIGRGVLEARLPEVARRFARDNAVVVTNTTVDALYPGRVQRALEAAGLRASTCALPDGEQYKTLADLNAVFDHLLAGRGNRKTLIVAHGGGVVGDMAGFAAATFMRGVPFIQVPTTLLACVDSSVGGKTAVNHPLGKNSIGAFKQPLHVLMDLDHLDTLPRREMVAGFFELAKHGLIHRPELFEYLERRPGLLEPGGRDDLEEAVAMSCRVKADVVEADEHETGLRATLNFGHTLGHLFETHAGYGQALHGEAVGAGMVFAADYSHRLGLLPAAERDRVVEFLRPHVRPIPLPPLDRERFEDLLLHDKKSSRNAVDFIVLEGVGRSAIRKGVAPAELWEAWGDFIQARPWCVRWTGAGE